MSGYVGAGFILTPVHEDPFLFGMGMQVYEHETVLLLEDSPFSEVYLRTTGFVITVPDSIQVVAGEAASVVAIDDSIRVEHWHYLEDEIFSQSLSLLAVRYQKANHALTDKGSWSLSWMHSASDEHNSFFFTTLEVCDS